MAEVNVSGDLIWAIVRSQNAYLTKRRSGGGAQFSRDPMNLMNKHSRKYAGFVNDKAIGIQPGEKGTVMTKKKPKNVHTPGSSTTSTNFSSGSSGKVYKNIATESTKGGYRSDLRPEAVARASMILKSQRQKKETPEKKLRGSKARKAAEKDSS